MCFLLTYIVTHVNGFFRLRTFFLDCPPSMSKPDAIAAMRLPSTVIFPKIVDVPLRHINSCASCLVERYYSGRWARCTVSAFYQAFYSFFCRRSRSRRTGHRSPANNLSPVRTRPTLGRRRHGESRRQPRAACGRSARQARCSSFTWRSRSIAGGAPAPVAPARSVPERHMQFTLASPCHLGALGRPFFCPRRNPRDGRARARERPFPSARASRWRARPPRGLRGNSRCGEGCR